MSEQDSHDAANIRIKRNMFDEMTELRRQRDASNAAVVALRESLYSLSTLAAASRIENTPEFLKILFAKIEAAQKLCIEHGQEPSGMQGG